MGRRSREDGVEDGYDEGTGKGMDRGSREDEGGRRQHEG